MLQLATEGDLTYLVHQLEFCIPGFISLPKLCKEQQAIVRGFCNISVA